MKILVVLGFAEDADARDDAALMAARGQGFDQEAIGFVASSVGRVVLGILGQEDAHVTAFGTGGLFYKVQTLGDS